MTRFPGADDAGRTGRPAERLDGAAGRPSDQRIDGERRKMQAVLDHSPAAIALWRGKNFEFEYVNRAYRELFPARVFDGRPLLEALPEVREQGFLPIFRRVLNTGRAFRGGEVPMRMQFKPGGPVELRYFDVDYVRVDGTADEPHGVLMNAVEVTDRVAARQAREMAVRETERSREDLTNALESMSDAFLSVDSNWRITGINSRASRVFRRDSAELIGADFRNVFPGGAAADLEQCHRAMRDRVATDVVAHDEAEDSWVRVRAFPKAHGGLAVFTTDVTDSQRAGRALAFERHKSAAIQDQAPVGIALLSGEPPRFEMVNQTWRTLVGDRDVTGKAFAEVYDAPTGIANAVEAVYKTGEAFATKGVEIAATPANGRPAPTWLDLNLLRICDGAGRPYGVAAIALDATDRIATERHLNTAKSEAERSTHLKSAFLANMSHEIRTPLGVMIGFTELLTDPSVTVEERSSYVDIVTRNGRQLTVIIDDILDLSKVESGHLSLEYIETDHRAIGEDLIAVLGPQARAKNLVFEYASDPGTPDTIVSDPTRVRQILLNLAGNAIKFTTEGSVRVRGFGDRGGDGRRTLGFDVTDTGIGLTTDQRARLFNAFSQADESTTRNFGGTGLGLALSRRLARALGGDVTIVDSELGRGSTFRVEIVDRPERRTRKAQSSAD